MKVALVLALCVVMAAASGYDSYKPGFRRGKNSIVARYNNAERQEAVNYRAEHIGRSSGTARWEGVPGTDLDFGYGYGYNNGYNRGYDRHDGYGNGYDRYDNNGYGHGHNAY